MISDGVVLLRPWQADDAEFMFTASRDPEIRRYNGPTPRSIEEAASTIADITSSWRTFHEGGPPTGAAFVICDDDSGRPLGMCGIDHWSPAGHVQFGYWLEASARGQGVATRAVSLLTTWLFEIGAARVFAIIKRENTASSAVVRRVGFVREETEPGADTAVYSRE